MAIRVQTPQGIVEFPDGTTPQQMERALSDSSMAVANGAPAESSRVARPDQVQPSYNRQWARAGVNALPGIGAGVGALAAAPFTAGLSIPAAISLGMIGGGLGSIGGQYVRSELAPSFGLEPSVPSSGQTAMDMAAAGLGFAAPPASQAVGRSLYHAGFSPGTARLSRMPDLMEVLAERGAIPTNRAAANIPGLTQQVAVERAAARSAALAPIKAQAAAEKNALAGSLETAADAARQGATTTSQSLISQAENSGRRFTAREAAGPALANAERFNRKPLTPGQERKVVAQVQNALDDALRQRSHGIRRPPIAPKATERRILDPYGLKITSEPPKRVPTTYSARDLDAARQFYYDRGKAVARGKGIVSPLSPIEDDVHAGIQEALHGAIPDLRAARAAEQQAIQTAQAVRSEGMAAVNRLARRGSPIAQQAVAGRQRISEAAHSAAGQAGARARTAPLSPAARELIVQQATLAAANRNPWLTRVGFPTALIPQMEARTGLALMNPGVQRLFQGTPLTADVLLRALLTPKEQPPVETFQPPPGWGGSTP